MNNCSKLCEFCSELTSGDGRAIMICSSALKLYDWFFKVFFSHWRCSFHDLCAQYRTLGMKTQHFYSFKLSIKELVIGVYVFLLETSFSGFFWPFFILFVNINRIDNDRITFIPSDSILVRRWMPDCCFLYSFNFFLLSKQSGSLDRFRV